MTRDTSHDPTHGLVRPRGRRRLLEDEQDCSSLIADISLAVYVVHQTLIIYMTLAANGVLWPGARSPPTVAQRSGDRLQAREGQEGRSC